MSFQAKGKLLQESHIPHKFLKICLPHEIFQDWVVIIFIVSPYLPPIFCNSFSLHDFGSRIGTIFTFECFLSPLIVKQCLVSFQANG